MTMNRGCEMKSTVRVREHIFFKTGYEKDVILNVTVFETIEQALFYLDGKVLLDGFFMSGNLMNAYLFDVRKELEGEKYYTLEVG